MKGEEIPLESRILKALHAVAKLETAKVPRFKAVEQLRHEPNLYDLKVLDALARSFAFAPPAADAARPPRAVTFAELCPGQELASDICTTDNIMIIGAGTKLTPFLMERLRNFASLSGLRGPIHIVQA